MQQAIDYQKIFWRAKFFSRSLAALSDSKRNEVLLRLADAIEANTAELLRANADDLNQMSQSNPLYDRLQLTENRLAGIASDMRHVAQLPSPLGRTLLKRTLPNGLRLRRVSVPFGVIGVVYEARPNVSFDVFSLCFKSGNVCILKGGHDADHSNRAIVNLIQDVLHTDFNMPREYVTLLPATHEATAELLSAVGMVDLCIPRGGKKLINFVRDTAKVPVIETGAGVVHAYFDVDGDLEMGKRIIFNAKTRRVSVCNTLDTLLVNAQRFNDLPELVAPLAVKNVKIYARQECYEVLSGHYPQHLLYHATEETFDTEWMDYALSVAGCHEITSALMHISEHGSGHSECIITNNEATARRFQQEVDAACVYWNAPTSFTDGAQFGLGAEIGISTQKLGPRGPMGLEEMTTYKWLIEGEGQTRE